MKIKQFKCKMITMPEILISSVNKVTRRKQDLGW